MALNEDQNHTVIRENDSKIKRNGPAEDTTEIIIMIINKSTIISVGFKNLENLPFFFFILFVKFFYF